MAAVEEHALANIARVDIVTEETTPVTYTLVDMADEADIKSYVSKGEEKQIRVKNTIKAANKTEDIVLGYDITLKSVTMQPEVLALVDGGTYDKTAKEYTAPVVGLAVTRKAFTLNIYTEEKDTNGDTTGYACFAFKHAKGTPFDYTIKDGDFFSEELKAESRPKSGESPVELAFLTVLPA